VPPGPSLALFEQGDTPARRGARSRVEAIQLGVVGLGIGGGLLYNSGQAAISPW
jgi:hypothetical protein